MERTVSLLIERPVDEVFAFMNDVASERTWQPNLRVAEQVPPGPPAVGAKRRYVSDFMGRRVENTYVIRSLEPGRRLVLETTDDSALSATSDITWEPVGAGTRVTMSVDGAPRGPLRLVPRRLLEATFERELRGALDRVKRILEGDR